MMLRWVRKLAPAAAVVSLGLVAPPVADAQDGGTDTWHRFGVSVAGVGDVNGDGVPDVVVAGFQGTDTRGYPYGAIAKVFSGKDGSVIRTHTSQPEVMAKAPCYFGEGAPSVACAGDLDRDGVPDIALGAPLTSPGGLEQAGTVKVYSGRDGKILLSLAGRTSGAHFGLSVAGGLDVNGDGTPDVVVGAPGAKTGKPGESSKQPWGTGQVQVFSGKDGAVLLSLDGPRMASEFGHAVALAADGNGDGSAEVAVSCPGAGGAGMVWLYSGKDGKVIFFAKGTPNPGPLADVTVDVDDFPGPPMFGSSVAVVGDTDGDGRPEFAIGARYAMSTGRRSEGEVQIRSGRDGAKMRSLSSPKDLVGPGLGSCVAGVGDVNGDGIPDLATSVPFAEPGYQGRVLVYSGKDGGLLLDIRSPAKGERFGESVAGVGDVNADGIPDIAVGQPGWTNMPGFGRAYVMSGKDGSLLRTLDCSKQ